MKNLDNPKEKKMEILVEDFVSALSDITKGFCLGPSILKDFYGKVTREEEIAYKLFCSDRAFECSIKLEQWQHELLNAVLPTKVADYCDINNVLDCKKAERFIFDRWNYYDDAWANGIEPNYPPTELPMSLARMLVQHKRYEELASDKERLDTDFLILSAIIMNFTTALIEKFKKVWEDFRITFNPNDTVKYAVFAVKFHEMWIEKKGFKNN